MDGNGRWAKKRGLPRKFGHREGAKAFKKIADHCMKLGIPYATFYAFSTENQKRPKDEVEALLRLFDEYLDDIREMDAKNVRLKFIGDLSFFPDSTHKKMLEAEEATGNNTGFTCSLALNYGGRDEILHAVKRLVTEGCNLSALNEESFAEYLYTKGLPDVDLIIRTAGERRLSNFLIWQAAYAEYVYTDTLFPDFGKRELDKALAEFGERNRRFGGV
ncbi:MAG: polyprenyl diphosphate synthase [Oscillospiraceae bacterium]|nr:polyprenyl diphosphate synthase [Oscillospiraceae bacterium]